MHVFHCNCYIFLDCEMKLVSCPRTKDNQKRRDFHSYLCHHLLPEIFQKELIFFYRKTSSVLWLLCLFYLSSKWTNGAIPKFLQENLSCNSLRPEAQWISHTPLSWEGSSPGDWGSLGLVERKRVLCLWRVLYLYPAQWILLKDRMLPTLLLCYYLESLEREATLLQGPDSDFLKVYESHDHHFLFSFCLCFACK